jgi:glycosyltransferase involved in cell wall biosynthesis
MVENRGQKRRVALVFGTLPTVEEIDQFVTLAEEYDISVVSSASICAFVAQTSRFQGLKCVMCPDFDENATYLPGLEKILGGFEMVIVKERLGLYAYQAVKAKWRHGFRLFSWVDNLTPFPGDDVTQLRTVRREITNGADGFLVQTEGARDMLALEGVAAERIHYMRPWIEQCAKRSHKAKLEARKGVGIKDGDFVIAHMGQVEWEEGLIDLANAAKAAITRDKTLSYKLKILVCGVGSLSDTLKQRGLALGIDEHIVYVVPNREGQRAVLASADCLFFGSSASRDRNDGDVFRLLPAMANEIPVIACRGHLVEEMIGKHRIDFCSGSTESLTAAIIKAYDANALRHDIGKKNAAEVSQKYNREKASREAHELIGRLISENTVPTLQNLDRQVLEVETMVANKQYAQAVEAIEAAFKSEVMPTHHRANLHRLIGDSFAKLGDLEMAKAAYMKAVEFDAFLYKGYIGLGTVAILRNAPDVAILQFQKAVSLAPEDEMANLGLAMGFQGIRESAEALKWAVKAITINPENQIALFTLVQLAYESGNYKTAETACRQYLARRPGDHNIMFSLAGALHMQALHDEALAVAEEILATDPRNEMAQTLHNQIKRGRMQKQDAAGQR